MKQISRIIILAWCLGFIFGCKTVSNMDELLVLKAISEEQADMDQVVQESNQRFEELVSAVKSEKILQYKNQSEIKETFGEPIFSESLQEDGKIMQKWLYRYSTNFFGSKKVYLYFDNAGNLLKWDLIE